MSSTSTAARQLGPNSPCISVCALHADGYCTGCLRTREEIGAWISLSPEQQWALVRSLDERRQKLTGK